MAALSTWHRFCSSSIATILAVGFSKCLAVTGVPQLSYLTA